LPFGALLRSTKPKPDYAVEHYNFGYMPTLYHFALFLQHRPQETQYSDAVIFGDPDGSLQGARKEATRIQQLLKATSSPYLGKDAQYETLVRRCPKASVVHLGTHGYFSKVSPDGSYMLFANDRRVTLFEFTTLPLKNTHMVVLAACETGLGAEGLEYATLARSFAWAGTPSILATLWRVNDEASLTLMEKFYEGLLNRDDRFTALAKAQRRMINSNNKLFQSPSAWACFIPFGKP
jgi:CHAT domain-containing protein